MARGIRRKMRILAKLRATLPKGHSISPGGKYLRVNTRYPVDFILRHVGEWMFMLKGHPVRMSSMRYRNFLAHGITCVACGVKGSYFYLERHAGHANPEKSPFHFNLYAADEEGREKLMTKDHIMPKSLGGSNSLDNFQTMCHRCNERKGNGIV